MPQLIKRAVVAAKVESTYNTDSVPTASADAVLVENLNYGLANLAMYQQPTVGATLATLAQIYAGALFRITCEVAIKGSGAAGTAPDFGILLRACACGETIVASTSVAYAPVSTGQESITIYLFEDGKRYPVTGIRGNVSGSAQTRNPGRLSFTFTGHLGTHTTVTLPTPTLDATVAPIFNSAGLTIGAYTPRFNAINFDLANTVTPGDDANGADGFGEVIITGRDVNGSIDPEDDTIANKDFLAELIAGTSQAISTGVIGSTAGNRWQITQPACVFRNWTPEERGGVRTKGMPYGCAESSGDDEWTLTLT